MATPTYRPFDHRSLFPIEQLTSFLRPSQPISLLDEMAQASARLVSEQEGEKARARQQLMGQMQEFPDMTLDDIEQEALDSGLLDTAVVLKRIRDDREDQLAREERAIQKLTLDATKPIRQKIGSEYVEIDPLTGRTKVLYRAKKETKGKEESIDRGELWLDPLGAPRYVPRETGWEQKNEMMQRGWSLPKKPTAAEALAEMFGVPSESSPLKAKLQANKSAVEEEPIIIKPMKKRS